MKRLSSYLLWGSILCAFFMISAPSMASPLTADDIAQKVDERDDGDNISSVLEMVLIDKHGNQRIRSMQKFEKDFGKDTYSVIFFLAPKDVKDTAFLTFDYADSNRDDDQWLYLPALRQTKRIVSSDKSSSFMGSDFSYADMTSRSVDDYTYKIAKESEVRGHKVWIMEVMPKRQKTIDETGYTKSYMFVRQDNFVVVRAIHFLKDGKRKYMDVKQLQKIEGIWVAIEIEMKTKKDKMTLHTTLLRLFDVRFNQDLKESFFTVRRIEKGL
ncbi:MAG TPA: outer membrane lipoprotein-sorting protein [Thiomicrorhabdus sp.]|nr:outer membrane lipoprotein-sorting protein [Thiomicrorhabdus sp.]